MKLFYGSNFYKNEKNVTFVNDAQLSLPYGITYFEKSMPFLDSLSYQKFQNKTLPDLFFDDDGFSFWWLILPSLTYFIIDAINFIDKFEIYIKKINPEHIRIIGNFEKFYLIKQICAKNKISFSYSRFSFLKFLMKNKFKNQSRNFFYLNILRKKFKKRINTFKSKSNKIPDFQNKIVFFSANVYRRQYFDYEKNSEITCEYLLEPLIPVIEDIEDEIIGIDVDYTFTGETKILEQRLDDSISWVPLEIILKNIPNNSYPLLSSYKNIISNPEFQKLFSYNEINFWSRVELDFQKISTIYYLNFLIDMIKKFEDFFSKSKPKAVLIPYEKGSYALALIIACKKLGIKTIGIQHGAFESLGHNDYAHTCLNSNTNPSGLPLPTHMLVWGSSAKNFLIEKGYDENQISILGNPEFFNIKKIKNQNLRSKFNFSSEKKIILFTTSKLQRGYMSDEKRAYDEYVLEELLNLFSNHPDYQIILKPHPVKETTFVYEEIMKKHNAKNCSILTNNILELIHLSDVLISVESSTIIDAIAMGKMVIEMIFDGSSWMDQKIAQKILLLSNLKDLKINIDKILNDKNLQNTFQQEQEKFLFEHYNFPNSNFDDVLKSVINS